MNQRSIEEIMSALAAGDDITREEVEEVLGLQVNFLRESHEDPEMTFEEGLEVLQAQLDFELSLGVSEEQLQESDGLRRAIRIWRGHNY